MTVTTTRTCDFCKNVIPPQADHIQLHLIQYGAAQSIDACSTDHLIHAILSLPAIPVPAAASA